MKESLNSLLPLLGLSLLLLQTGCIERVTPAAQTTRSQPLGTELVVPSEEKVNLKGKILATVLYPSQTIGEEDHIHLVVQAKNQVVKVKLGPQSFCREQAIDVSYDASIELIGFYKIEGTNLCLIAEKVQQASRSITLRDSTGSPLWHSVSYYLSLK